MVLKLADAPEVTAEVKAPTTSTTATLAMGDALAVVLLNRKKFRAEDFRRNHPGGSLGERLKVAVGEVMLTGESVPSVPVTVTMQAAVAELDRKNLGAVFVTSGAGLLRGIVTDGDIRRGFEKGNEFLDQKVEDFMTREPRTIMPGELAAKALHIMESHRPRPVTVLPVVDTDQHSIGMLHITDLLRRGMV